MRRILSVLGSACRRFILMLCLASLISLSALFLVGAQPSYAAPIAKGNPMPSETTFPSYGNNQAPETRAEAYEEAVEDAQNLQSIEKAYEENLQAYKEDHPDPSLIEQAEEVIEKITGNE